MLRWSCLRVYPSHLAQMDLRLSGKMTMALTAVSGTPTF